MLTDLAADDPIKGESKRIELSTCTLNFGGYRFDKYILEGRVGCVITMYYRLKLFHPDVNKDLFRESKPLEEIKDRILNKRGGTTYNSIEHTAGVLAVTDINQAKEFLDWIRKNTQKPKIEE